MNYQEALEYVRELSAGGIVPGLESIRNLCAQLDDPQKELRFIHIAGTNGKGSVLAYLSTILKCAGYRVGRYLSPALGSACETIQAGGRNITQKAYAEGMEQIRQACMRLTAKGLPQPTAFEAETALALWYFRKRQCDIVVWETGMGGLSDATNLVENTLVAVITSIGMDHMQFLGKSLEEIAAQKAGILKKGCCVVCMKQRPEALAVVRRKAEQIGAPLFLSDAGQATQVRYGLEKQRFSYGGYRNLEISLAGKYQIDNAVLAVDTVKALGRQGIAVSPEALRRGLLETRWDGRLTVLQKKPLFLADGAHNEDAAQKLADSIEFYFTNRRIIYIMGILKDKEVEKVIALTHAYADQIITVTPPDNPRALPAYALAQEIAKVHPAVTAADSLEEAVEMSLLLAGEGDVILAFGSLSYLGKLMEIVRKNSGSRKNKGSGKTPVRGNR